MPIKKIYPVELYQERRKKLVESIKKDTPDARGVVVLIAGFEQEREPFRQESSFYYLTGIQEPAVIFIMDLDTSATLYVPNYAVNRTAWVADALSIDQAGAQKAGVASIERSGDPCSGYQMYPSFNTKEYATVIERLKSTVEAGGSIYTLSPRNPSAYSEQRSVLSRFYTDAPALRESVVDISPFVARMRRFKSNEEIELMYEAVGITLTAQEAAAQRIGNGVREYEVQAALEYVFTESGASRAFPSIVGSGSNATTLHYNRNDGVMHDGDLVVVDIGAEYANYAADITRTYPVSGTFTERQKEVYNLVLETQRFIADIAMPGYWLRNNDQQEKSLHHIAVAFLKERGYSQYFIHGLGHFLGLDVHDVGDYKEPLHEGDVITIEPGLYIPQERIGIRIEDNFLMTNDGAVCLSQELPADVEVVENLVQQTF